MRDAILMHKNAEILKAQGRRLSYLRHLQRTMTPHEFEEFKQLIDYSHHRRLEIRRKVLERYRR